jgi:hypothetical protein
MSAAPLSPATPIAPCGKCQGAAPTHAGLPSPVRTERCRCDAHYRQPDGAATGMGKPLQLRTLLLPLVVWDDDDVVAYRLNGQRRSKGIDKVGQPSTCQGRRCTPTWPAASVVQVCLFLGS